MPKYEAVVILMQQSFNDVTMLFPQSISEEQLQNIPATKPFADDTVAFLHALSQELNKDPLVRSFPDVATFAFFCRRANILQIKERYSNDDLIRLGRGIAFHIAPSNVPVNFAYSLLCGLLSGNVNIVRVPSKDFEQVSIISKAIARIAPAHNECASRIVLVRYERTSDATSLFSALCDVRIIWGGDETIAQIRRSPIPARSFDVCFADRYSICAINAAKYLADTAYESVAQGFYNDTYLFDQNACTAPHLVVWIGSESDVTKAKSLFWSALHTIVKQKYGAVQPVVAVDKLTALYNQAAQNEGVHQVSTEDNLLWRVAIDELQPRIEDFRCSSGYFTEYNATALDDLKKVINRKYQTLAYYGFEKSELTEFVLRSGLQGIDRIVPVGRSTDFSVVWDGYDLLYSLTRVCSIL